MLSVNKISSVWSYRKRCPILAQYDDSCPESYTQMSKDGWILSFAARYIVVKLNWMCISICTCVAYTRSAHSVRYLQHAINMCSLSTYTQTLTHSVSARLNSLLAYEPDRLYMSSCVCVNVCFHFLLVQEWVATLVYISCVCGVQGINSEILVLFACSCFVRFSLSWIT